MSDDCEGKKVLADDLIGHGGVLVGGAVVGKDVVVEVLSNERKIFGISLSEVRQVEQVIQHC